MTAALTSPPRVVLYEGPGSEPLTATDRSSLLADLLDQ